MPRDLFLCDGMLGDLARWLRLLGFDAAYAGSEVSDAAVLAQAGRDGRLVVTRDVALHQAAVRQELPCVLLGAADRAAALEEVLRAAEVRPDPARFFTRCTACNAPLEAVGRDQVLGAVPPRVAELHERFRRCPRCGKVYWEGSHLQGIEPELRRLMERLSTAPGPR